MKRSIWSAAVAGLVVVAGVGEAGGLLGTEPALAQPASKEKVRVGTIELTGALSEQPGPFAWLVGDGEETTLRQVVGAFDRAAERDDLDAVVVRLKDAELTTTQIEELGAAMARLRASGKTIHLFAEGYSTAELLLGSHADEAIIQSGGAVAFPGLYMEEMFFADTLGWAGVKADMVQVGDYKGASESMARAAPSPEWDRNINQLLDSMYENIRAAIKHGRGLCDADLDAAMERAWMADAATALEVGLVDTALDLPALSAHLAQHHGAEVAWVKGPGTGKDGSKMDMSNPLAMFSLLSKRPSHKPTSPTIAVVHIDGPIVDGESQAAGLMGGSSVGSRTIRKALEEIREQDLIKGVIVRVNSPGGSAIASEVMWQGFRRVAETKPVWVSIGSMAASGGYYVAVAGDRIYVNPSSIVGSIGVVGGKMALSGLYDRLKVNVVGRGRGPLAGMFNSAQAWSPEQIALVRAKMTEIYDLFTARVSSGRPGIDLAATAEGRLFTGDKAIALKMADEIGGLDDAIGDLAAELDLDEYGVMDYPGPKGFDELFEDLLGGFAGARAPAPRSAFLTEAVGLLQELVGPRSWPMVRDSLAAWMQLRDEPVLLAMPRAIIIR